MCKEFIYFKTIIIAALFLVFIGAYFLPNISLAACVNNSDCGINQTCFHGACISACTSHYSKKCADNNLYWFDSCNNKEDAAEYCLNGCQNNYCLAQKTIIVQTNSATNIFNNQATLNGYVYGTNSDKPNYIWFQWGASTSYGYETSRQTQKETGSFSQNIANLSSGAIYHFRAVAKNNSGNTVYGSDMIFTAGPQNQAEDLISVNKAVRNLSSGSLSWSNSVYASPSDILMFAITVRPAGNQNIRSLTIRDSLPSNLIYKNQTFVSSGPSVYSGDIISGINFATVAAGQIITITYQAQVASPQNFNYGTTTLNNNVYINSLEPSLNRTAKSVIIVSKEDILGATTVSTGLTNNFLVDSFFLPLMIALIGVWLFKSDVFGLEKWIDGRKTRSSEYRAQKQLKAKINQIKEAEKS